MKTTRDNQNSMTTNVRERYLNSGFKERDSGTGNLLRFGNDFSEHFVFLFDSLDDVLENWKQEHGRVIEVYREYSGPRDMEWNFYAIFLYEEASTDPRAGDSRRKIESDTAYSRKFVLSVCEIDTLPPGRITQRDLGNSRRKETNLVENWQKVLGDRLFQSLVESPKKALPTLMQDYIRQKKDGN